MKVNQTNDNGNNIRGQRELLADVFALSTDSRQLTFKFHFQRIFHYGEFFKVKFTFARRYGFYLFQSYFPTSLTVISSWVGFFFDVRSVSARYRFVFYSICLSASTIDYFLIFWEISILLLIERKFQNNFGCIIVASTYIPIRQCFTASTSS